MFSGCEFELLIDKLLKPVWMKNNRISLFTSAIIVLFSLNFQSVFCQKEEAQTVSFISVYEEDVSLRDAKGFLSKSLPDRGLEVLFLALKNKDNKPEFTNLCNIYVAEAYRQKREYKKGLDLLFEIVKKKIS
jgi:hypothetical protein